MSSTTVTSYDNDSRVTHYREDLFEVDAPDGRYSVEYWNMGSSDAWRVLSSEGRFSGSFLSANDAIYSLIGEPQQ